MNRLTLIWLTAFLLSLCEAHAANVQIKDLPTTTGVGSSDITQIETLVGGAYHDRQITIGNLSLSLSIGGSQLTGSYSSSTLTLNSGKLLGRASAGSGTAEELAADGTLNLSAGTLGVNNASIAPIWSNITGVPANITALAGSQSANLVLAGPASGSAAAPAFRRLAAADFPNLVVRALSADGPPIASTTTLASSPTLQFNAGANETWQFEIVILVNQTSFAPGVQWGMNSTEAVAWGWWKSWDDASGVGIPGLIAESGTDGQNPFYNFTGVSSTTIAASSGPLTLSGLIAGVVKMGPTAGVVAFQLAQGTSSTDAINLLQGSYLIAHKVAP